MKMVFFHNQHDVESRALLETLQSDPSLVVDVVDVFAYPPPKIPSKIRLTELPALFTRQFVLLEPPSLNTTAPDGVLTVKLGCYDLDNNPIIPTEAELHRKFFVYVNGVLYNDNATPQLVTGVTTMTLVFEFEVNPGMSLHLRIEADEYTPFDEVFTIVAG